MELHAEYTRKTDITIQAKRRKKNTRFHRVSLPGGLKAALEQNSAKSGARGLVQVVMYKVGYAAIYKWETRLATHLLVRARQWYQSHYNYIAAQLQMSRRLGPLDVPLDNLDDFGVIKGTNPPAPCNARAARAPLTPGP